MRKFIFILLFLLTPFVSKSQDVIESLIIQHDITFPDGSVQTTAYPVSYFNVSTNLIFRGEWTSIATYYTNDYVSYQGNIFFIYTNVAQVGQAPSVNASSIGQNSAYWQVLISKGNKGDKGDSGVSLTQQIVRTVSSPTNFIAWVSNNANATIAYWTVCLTNGTASGSGGAAKPDGGSSNTYWHTQQVFQAVSSSSNFLSWASNNALGTVSYWIGCFTNLGIGGGGPITITNNFIITNNITASVNQTNLNNITNINTIITFNSITNIHPITNLVQTTITNSSIVTITNYVTLTNIVTHTNQTSVNLINPTVSDNLGNHTAITNLNMAGFSITNIATNSLKFTDGNSISTSSSNLLFNNIILATTNIVVDIANNIGSNNFATIAQITNLTSLTTNSYANTNYIRSLNGAVLGRIIADNYYNEITEEGAFPAFIARYNSDISATIQSDSSAGYLAIQNDGNWGYIGISTNLVGLPTGMAQWKRIGFDYVWADLLDQYDTNINAATFNGVGSGVSYTNEVILKDPSSPGNVITQTWIFIKGIRTQ